MVVKIQNDLNVIDHHIHAYPIYVKDDVASLAKITASSVFNDCQQIQSWGTEQLIGSRMQLLSIATERVEQINIKMDVASDTLLEFGFYQGPSNYSTYPDKKLTEGKVSIVAGENQWVTIPVSCKIIQPGWHFLVFENNPLIRLHVTETPPGRLRYYPRPEDPIRPNPYSSWTLRSLAIGQKKAADADGAKVTAPEWNEQALQFKAMSSFLGFSYLCNVSPVQPIYEPTQVSNPQSRPTNLPNLWVSAETNFEKSEWIELEWEEPMDLKSIQILFDSSLQFHFGQSWQGYQTNALPSIVKQYKIISISSDGSEKCLFTIDSNFQRNCRHALNIQDVKKIRVVCLGTHGIPRAQIYSIRVIGKTSQNNI